MTAYKHLSGSDRLAIVAEQLKRFEADLFVHELNIARLEVEREHGADVDDSVAEIRQAMVMIERAIETTEAQASANGDQPARDFSTSADRG